MDFFLIFLSQILSLIQCQYSINHNIHYKTHDNYITDGSECKTDFECRETACCNDGKCKDSKECFKEVKKMYIIFTIIGVVFLLAIIGYYIYIIMKTRANVKKIQRKNSRKANLATKLSKKREEEKNKKEEEEIKKKEEEEKKKEEKDNKKDKDIEDQEKNKNVKKGGFMSNILKINS